MAHSFATQDAEKSSALLQHTKAVSDFIGFHVRLIFCLLFLLFLNSKISSVFLESEEISLVITVLATGALILLGLFILHFYLYMVATGYFAIKSWENRGVWRLVWLLCYFYFQLFFAIIYLLLAFNQISLGWWE